MRRKWDGGQTLSSDREAAVDWVIAFASQSGNARARAASAAETLGQRGVQVELLPIGKLTPELLATTRHMLFIVSTYGNGEPPDMARGFTSRILRGDAINLSHLRYGLLALGDQGFPFFCGYGRTVEDWLARSGARPLFPPVMMDRRFPDMVEPWDAALRDVMLDG